MNGVGWNGGKPADREETRSMRRLFGSVGHGLFVGLAVASAMAATVSSGRAASTEENYERFCSACHGKDGSGNGPAAKVLNKHPGDFTDCNAMKAHKREFLLRIIAEGGAAVGRSSQMPGMSKKLSPKEIEELAHYVSTGFCKPR
jgi:mono/diheme cytochrome c family protein